MRRPVMPFWSWYFGWKWRVIERCVDDAEYMRDLTLREYSRSALAKEVRRKLTRLVMLACLLSGCVLDTSAIRAMDRAYYEAHDHAADAVVDAVPDVVADAVVDAVPDVDAVRDVVADGVVDAVPDVVADAAVDAVPDVVADAAVDAVPDVVADAVVDAVPDVDAMPDVDAVPDVESDAAVDAVPCSLSCGFQQCVVAADGPHCCVSAQGSCLSCVTDPRYPLCALVGSDVWCCR